MLIDATHAEETRVVVLDGSRLEDFDVETQSRKATQGQHLPRENRPGRAQPAGRLRRVRRQPARISGLQRNPPGLLSNTGGGPAAPASQMQEEDARAEEEAEDNEAGDEVAQPLQVSPSTSSRARPTVSATNPRSNAADGDGLQRSTRTPHSVRRPNLRTAAAQPEHHAPAPLSECRYGHRGVPRMRLAKLGADRGAGIHTS